MLQTRESLEHAYAADFQEDARSGYCLVRLLVLRMVLLLMLLLGLVLLLG